MDSVYADSVKEGFVEGSAEVIHVCGYKLGRSELTEVMVILGELAGQE